MGDGAWRAELVSSPTLYSDNGSTLRRLAGRSFRIILRWWRLGMALGLVVSLFAVIGKESLLSTLRSASPRHVAEVVFLLYAWLLLGGLNVWLLLRRLHELSLRRFLPAYLVAWASSMLLPGQLGDATQVLFLRGECVPMASSGASYVIDKVSSLLWLILVAAVGTWVFFPVSALATGLFLLFVSLSAALALTLVRKGLALRNARALSVLARLRRLGENIALFGRFRATVALNLALTMVKWVVLAEIYGRAFTTFGVEISWLSAATLPVMSSLVGYLPISVAGVGTMEWTAVALFARVGVAAADVVCAYLLLRVILYSTALAVLAFIHLRQGPPAAPERSS